MQQEVSKASSKRQPASRLRAMLPLFLAPVLLAGLTLGVHAQSGRKIPKQPNRDTPSSTKPEEPAAREPESNKDSAKIAVFVAYDDQLYIDTLASIVMDGILQRLKEVPSIKAQIGMREYNRKEASDVAKGSENNVLWWEFRLDSAQGLPPVGRTSREIERLYISFVVYSAGTGKLKTTGNVYQRSVGLTGGLPPRLPRTTGGAPEYSLYEAGIETADRLLSILGIQSLPKIPRTAPAF